MKQPKLYMMIEHKIQLEEIDPLVFSGTNLSNLNLIQTLFPELSIIFRGNTITIKGNEKEIKRMESALNDLFSHIETEGSLSEETIISIVSQNKKPALPSKQPILFNNTGKPILARNNSQERLIQSYEKNDLIFAVGPAGSGKTYIAIALAVKALKEKTVKRIILSRPAVEAGEKLGFLPGDMKEKIDPYLQPIYDALQELLPPLKLKEYLESNIIQIAPLAFMRGRTLSDAIVILDEAQNTTTQQIKMFMTRLGMNAKMLITGDITQIDLPSSQKSGLVESMRILRQVKGIDFIVFDRSEIVRHKLVQRIVEAFEEDDTTK